MENIFEINNQVFGLNFREIRVSSKTRRAMRSEFVTPANSVEMTYDDVCDVNGGWTLLGWSSTKFMNNLTALTDAVVEFASSFYGFGIICTCLKNMIALGWQYAQIAFPAASAKVASFISATGIPVLVALGIIVVAAGVGLTVAMGYNKMFY